MALYYFASIDNPQLWRMLVMFSNPHRCKMTFTLPSYCRQLPSTLATATELGSDDNGRKFRATDFDGLNAHDQLMRKLAILTLRGTYQSEESV